MKAKIVLAALLVSIMVVEVSAQRAEYDDMYFRGKDREKNKAIDAEESLYASAKTTKQKQDDFVSQEEDNLNPTDSYSARNVNPEYVSRSNSEKASEDESNYYLEGYNPAPASSTSNFNNSYYNNANSASNSYYSNNSWNSPYYGNCACNNSWMNPGYGYSPYGYGSPYGMSTGLSMSFMFGNSWNTYGSYGYGNPYYGGYGNPYYGGYGNPYYGGYGNYYGGNTNYNEPPRVVNYGKRPSRNSAIITPTTRPSRGSASTNGSISTNSSTQNNATVSNGRTTRTRQVQDDYYVRPSRRGSTSGFDNSTQRSGSGNSFWTPSNNNNSSQPTRSRETYSPPTRSSSYSPSSSPSYSPSSSPSSSPSRGSSGGSGGGSSPRPRGGRD